MELPHSKIKRKYVNDIKNIETWLKETSSQKLDKAENSEIQKALDDMASKYQHDQEIGSARYKMYELQAIMHYLNGDDESALDFIDYAIELRGSEYPRALKIRDKINTNDNNEETVVGKMSKSEKRKKLIGVEGWLALFVVGVGIGIVLNLIGLIAYPETFNDINQLRNDMPELASALLPLFWFEVFQHVLLISLGTSFIVLAAKHRKIAKDIGITLLLVTIVALIIDHGWISSIDSGFDIGLGGEAKELLESLGRSLILGAIWVPYLLLSKRVKATLTK